MQLQGHLSSEVSSSLITYCCSCRLLDCNNVCTHCSTYNGNWSFKLADRMTVTARVGDMSLNLNGDLYSGRVDATWAHADGDFKYSANYLREASPFK